ncbi:MAG: branched-chain amino acid ABC transporter permease [Bradyrhizobiaceae bacterium]|nr:MAG: branched-chain amino acid ABC transporter permease [Bradyrhizobiaceae bacterium]
MTQHPPSPYWSMAGLSLGARLAVPFLPGTAVFAAAFGTIAAQKGLTLAEAVLMSAVVFAGASQLVAMEVWAEPLTLATVASIAVVTAIVNMRFLLMGASLRPWFGPLPAWQVYPALLTTTDANWLVAIRYRTEGGGDAAVFLGVALTLWVFWVGSTVPGYLLGAVVSDPKRFGLDLVMPAFFAAMMIPLWRGPRRGVGWAVAGAVALAAAHLVPGWWFIVIGALAGALIGGLLDDRD